MANKFFEKIMLSNIKKPDSKEKNLNSQAEGEPEGDNTAEGEPEGNKEGEPEVTQDDVLNAAVLALEERTEMEEALALAAEEITKLSAEIEELKALSAKQPKEVSDAFKKLQAALATSKEKDLASQKEKQNSINSGQITQQKNLGIQDQFSSNGWGLF